jgi:hypothetical protein
LIFLWVIVQSGKSWWRLVIELCATSRVLWKAEFIIQKIEEYIQCTMNPYVQVVELIGRKKSYKSFDHLVTDVCERVKLCALYKVTNVTDWFTSMIVVAKNDHVEVRKKLLWRKALRWIRPKQSTKKKKRLQKCLACLEQTVRLAKQARLKQKSQNQESHHTNQVMEADSIIAVKHHMEVEDATINNKIKEDHHQEKVLKVPINPDQETEAEETATDVEIRIKGPVPRLIRSAKTVRRWVTRCEPAELVYPLRPHQASQHRWLNKTALVDKQIKVVPMAK